MMTQPLRKTGAMHKLFICGNMRGRGELGAQTLGCQSCCRLVNSRNQQEGVQGRPCQPLEGAEVGEVHYREVVGEVVECCHQLPCPLPLQPAEAGHELQTGAGKSTASLCRPTLKVCP